MDLIMPDMNLVRSLKAPGGDDAYAEELLAANLNPLPANRISRWLSGAEF